MELSEPVVEGTARDVGRRVHEAIWRRRIPQTEVAGWLNMSQAAVSRRIQGFIPFDVVELQKIADMLGLPIEDFFRGEPAA